jgi:hypothetical protein
VRLHRSIIFWAGLLVLAFLLIAWCDSRSKSTNLAWVSGGSSFVLGIGNDRCVLWLGHYRSAGSSGVRSSFHFERDEVLTDPFADVLPAPPAALAPAPLPWFPKAYRGTVMNGIGEIGIAHWLLVLLHITLWAALLYYRHRRIRKARDTTASLPV